MQPVVHDFYNHLKEGKILGHRCAACGAVQFPPMGLCPECGTNDLSWFPLSGKGTLLFASVGRHPMMEITFLQGTVKIEEGPLISGMLLDDSFDFSRPEKVFEYNGANMPVRLVIVKNTEGTEAVAFRLDK